MWRITLLTAVCLCFVLDFSSAATPAATTKATAAGTPTKSGSSAATGKSSTSAPAPTANPGPTSAPGQSSNPTPAPNAAVTKPQKYSCTEYHCMGETCYNSTTTKKACQGKFCVITAFKSGNQISLGGSCAPTCNDKVDGNNKTHCCQGNNCNTNKNEVAKAVDFSGAVFWTVNLLFLFLMQAVAFALNV